MEFVLGLVIGLVVGFVGGFLVFRNNQTKINDLEAKLEKQSKDIADTVKKAVDDIKNSGKDE